MLRMGYCKQCQTLTTLNKALQCAYCAAIGRATKPEEQLVWTRKDAIITEIAACCRCGTCWGGAIGAAKKGHHCAETRCLACGSIVCMSHGFTRGQCPICHLGILPNWSGSDCKCSYANCPREVRAIARSGSRNVCPDHALKARAVGTGCKETVAKYIRRRLEARTQEWKVVQWFRKEEKNE